MKGFTDRHGNKIAGVSILESIIVHPRKLNKLVIALSSLNLSIDPAVQIADKNSSWVVK